MTNEWQPIETAPRDALIMAWGEGSEWPEVVRWDEWEGVGYWIYAEPLMNDVAGEAVNLTHWMPLPAPPEGEA